MDTFIMGGFFIIVAILCTPALVEVASYLMVQVDLAIEELEESVPGFQSIVHFTYVAAIFIGGLAHYYGDTALELFRLVAKLMSSHIISAVLLCTLVISIRFAITNAKKVSEFLERCTVARDRSILNMQDELEMTRREASDSTKEKQTRIRELERCLNDALENNKELQARFDKVETTYTETSDRIDFLNSQIDKLETERKNLKETLSSQSEKLVAGQKSYKDLECDFFNLYVDFTKLQEEQSVQPQQPCQACLAGSNSVVIKKEEELDCLAKKLAEANTKIYLQERIIADFKTPSQEQSTTIQQVQNGEVTSNQASLVRSSSKEKVKIAKLTRKLAACEEGRKANVKALEQQIATLKANVNDLSIEQPSQPVAITAEQQEIINNHAALTAECDRLRAERDSLVERQSVASKDLADAKIAAQQAEEKALKFEDAARQSHAHQVEADQLKRAIEELKKILQVQNPAGLIKEVWARVNKIKHLQGKSETLQVDCKTLQENNKLLSDQKQSLEKAKESLDKEKLSLETAHQQLQAKLQRTQTDLQRTQAELQQSRAELQESQADYKELQVKSSNFEKQQECIARSQIFKLDPSVEQLLSNTLQERDNFREVGQMLEAELMRLHQVAQAKLEEMAEALAKEKVKDMKEIIQKTEMERAAQHYAKRDQDNERNLDRLRSDIAYRAKEVRKVSHAYTELEQKFNHCQLELQVFQTRENERLQCYGPYFEKCYKWFVDNSWHNLEYMGQQRYGLARPQHLSNGERAQRYNWIIDRAAKELFEMSKRSAQELAPVVNAQTIANTDAGQATAVAVIADDNAVGNTEGMEVQTTSTRAETATETSSTAATTSSAAPAASGLTQSASAGPLPPPIPTEPSKLGKRRREFSDFSGDDQEPDVDADDDDMEGTNESNVKEDQKRRKGNNPEEDQYWKD